MLIVDASVAVKWVLNEDGSEAAVALGRQDTLAAPEFWLIEVANVIWKRWRRGDMTADAAAGAFEVLQSAAVIPIRLDALLSDAMHYAIMLDHPVYDCLYIAAAIQNDTVLVTADRKFVAVASRYEAISAHIRIL
jgi:predicted nucleic acid-binding protein